MASKRHRTRAQAASRVLSVKQFAAFNNVSYATALRMIKAGIGPVVIEISPGRIGVTERANAEWQAARTRDAR